MKTSLNKKAFSLVELALSMGGMAMIMVIVGATFLLLNQRFLASYNTNKAQAHLMEAAFSLRRIIPQARHLAGVDNTSGDIDNFFSGPSSDGKIVTGISTNGTLPFDSAAIADSPENQGQYFFIAKFERDEGSGMGMSEFMPTAIYYKTPDRTSDDPYEKTGALLIMSGSGGVNINMAPQRSGYVFQDVSRFRIKDSTFYPGTRLVSSVTFEITIRYFLFGSGKKQYWYQAPRTPDDATFKDISRDVTVIVRNNLLNNSGGVLLSAGQIRPYNGLYFFKPLFFSRY